MTELSGLPPSRSTSVTEAVPASGAGGDWHEQLAHAIRDPATLLQRLGLGSSLDPRAAQATRDFGVMVPEDFLSRMSPGDPQDPLLLQVLPCSDEAAPAGAPVDAVGDLVARRAPGLIHKYQGRALMISTGSCAVHCRYCFRRHYPYGDEPRRLDEWDEAIGVLAADETIDEVILSGGDPLMLTDARLDELITRLEEIQHLSRLRLHTRLPIVLPARVTETLVGRLSESRLRSVVVVHANHPAEIVGPCASALGRLVDAGLTLLNQSVLLARINDDTETLVELSRRLVDLGVIPYYLHQLDRVEGVGHFEVPETVGRRLVEEMRSRLPGYAVPRYVREVPGEVGKTLLD